MTFRKIIGKLHLSLGLASGLVVFIVAITGCIYAFQAELQDLTQPYRFVEEQQAEFLPPSKLIAAADEAFPDKLVHGVQYYGAGRAAQVIYWSWEEKYYYFVYVNPYTAEVLKVKNEFRDFFRIVLDGHFYLWLPEDVGQPVVASATLVFVAMLISGLILWWPRKKNGRKQRFSIKWSARWRRKNYDLHNVLGFYVMAIALVFALTGLVWGFEWFRDGAFKIASGGDDYVEYSTPASTPPTQVANVDAEMPAIDRVWLKMRSEYPQAEAMEIHPPEYEHGAIAANANPDGGTYWKMDYRYFDQYTLEELDVDHIWNRFEASTGAEKLFRMNYDIHTGAILGLPGKIFAFFISLIIASLPITGFMVWYGRKNKKPKKTAALQTGMRTAKKKRELVEA